MQRVLICSITSKPALAWSTFVFVYIRGICIVIAQGLFHNTDFTPGCDVQFTGLSAIEMPLLMARADCRFRSHLKSGALLERRGQSRKENKKRTKDKGTYSFAFLSRKHLFLRRPAQSCTPTMPNIKNTKKHSRRTLPNIGKVSRSRVTSILIPAQTREQRETVKHMHLQVIFYQTFLNLTRHNKQWHFILPKNGIFSGRFISPQFARSICDLFDEHDWTLGDLKYLQDLACGLECTLYRCYTIFNGKLLSIKKPSITHRS